MVGGGMSVTVLLVLVASATVPGPAAATNDPAPRFEGKAIMTMKDDLAKRSPDIHWPVGFFPQEADLFAHNEGLVEATCEQVWKHIVAAPKWPQWYPNSKSVQIRGGAEELSAGSVFTWVTFGLPIESKIHEFVPARRIGWYGYSPGSEPNFYHTWFLTQTEDGCQVVTEEVGKGETAKQLRRADEGLMHRGHDLWIATLKWVAEAR
jgi:uncharacterized protein YndB with AHSA1/START domain